MATEALDEGGRRVHPVDGAAVHDRAFAAVLGSAAGRDGFLLRFPTLLDAQFSLACALSSQGALLGYGVGDGRFSDDLASWQKLPKLADGHDAWGRCVHILLRCLHGDG